jgi:WD40 repeat protein
MNRTLFTFCVTITIVGAVWLLYDIFLRTPAADFSAQFGKPGPHNEHRRLPNLPLDIVFEQNRSRVIARQDDGNIHAWDTATGKARLIVWTESLFAYCRARELLLINASNNVVLVDVASNAKRHVVSGEYDHAAWSKDCSSFAIAGEGSRTVEIWKSESLAKYATAATKMSVRNGLAMSDNGQFVAAATGTYSKEPDLIGRKIGHRTALEVFEVSGEAQIARTASLDDPMTILGMWKMAFAPDAQALIVGSQIDGKSGLRTIRPQTGDVSWGQNGFESYWVRALAVSPNGQLAVSGDEKGLLRGWDVETGERKFERRTGLVIQSLAFSEDGKTLAMALWDSTIGLLDVAELEK